MTLRRRQARAEAIELVMEALAQDLELGDELAAMTHHAEPCRASQTSAAQSRSSDLKRREPSCARASCVSEGASKRTRPGKRRSSSAVQGRWSDPVASTAINGSPALPLAPISRTSSSTPVRNVGSDSGSCTSPRSPLTSQTRFATLPGSIATTNVSAGSGS